MMKKSTPVLGKPFHRAISASSPLATAEVLMFSSFFITETNSMYSLSLPLVMPAQDDHLLSSSVLALKLSLGLYNGGKRRSCRRAANDHLRIKSSTHSLDWSQRHYDKRANIKAHRLRGRRL